MEDEITAVRQTMELPAPDGANERLLGQILLRQGRVSQEQIDDALQAQREEGGRIGEILIRRGFATEDEVMRALSLQLDLPLSKDLKPEECDAELALKVPINFAKQHRLIPIRRVGRAVEVAVADPLDVHSLDDVSRTLGSELLPVLVPGGKILEAINKIYARQESGVELGEGEEGEMAGEAEELTDILDLTDEAPIIRWVNSIMFQAVKERASDIHIEPREKELIVRYRVDGDLREAKHANRNYVNSILSRVKIMAGLNIAEKRLPQDGRIRIRLAGKDIDIRVSIVPTAFGERVVMRLLDKATTVLQLEELGLMGVKLDLVHKLIKQSHGILLVTGPTGSGKTTTLYAALSKINTNDKNIITIEDPVEYQLHGIGQIQVNPKIELTFASGLRSILRQDPDVIMVGEIRDLETAEIAIQAALTGHLVFSTLHTNDSFGAMTRLLDMGIEPFLVSSSVIAVMAQRLVRRVCSSCREPYQPTREEMEELGIAPQRLMGKTIYKLGQGCAQCKRTGYRGRTGIHELLVVDDEVRTLVMKSADAATIRRAATARGMNTLREDGADKVVEGTTTIEEILRVTQEDLV